MITHPLIGPLADILPPLSKQGPRPAGSVIEHNLRVFHDLDPEWNIGIISRTLNEGIERMSPRQIPLYLMRVVIAARALDLAVPEALGELALAGFTRRFEIASGLDHSIEKLNMKHLPLDWINQICTLTILDEGSRGGLRSLIEDTHAAFAGIRDAIQEKCSELFREAETPEAALDRGDERVTRLTEIEDQLSNAAVAIQGSSGSLRRVSRKEAERGRAEARLLMHTM